MLKKILSLVSIISFFTWTNIQAMVADIPVTKALPKGIVLCVSLGMPDQVLRQYLKQAHALNIPIVIRGMLNNDMKATSNRLFQLLNPPNEPVIPGGIAIDPHSFKLANVQVVPTLVISDGYQIDTVKGNSPLAQLIHMAAKDGSTQMLRMVAAAYEKDGEMK